MVIVALYATTTFNTAQLRFGSYITDKFVDEEFDANIKKTFYDVANVGEFWDWVDNVFLDGLYPDHNFLHASQNPIDQVSLLVGAVNIRQVRGSRTRCQNSLGVAEHILPPGGICIMEDTHIEENIEKRPFGNGDKYQFDKQVGKYYEDNVLGDRYWQFRYRKGGYIVTLPPGNRTQAEKIIHDLKEDEFVSVRNGTRLIAIDFGVYNPHADCVASVRLVFEFWPAGGYAGADTTLLTFQKDKMNFGLNLAKILLLG